MRLIDADELKVYHGINVGANYGGLRAIVFKRDIDNAPTIDAVPVVRCAECKWFQCNMSMEGYLPKGVDEFECRHWCGSCGPDGYCGWAERKE